MTKTQELQEYCDEIYGVGFYKVEYESFKGFTAVSQLPDTPPHAHFLGITAAHAHSHLDDMVEMAVAREEMVAEFEAGA